MEVGEGGRRTRTTTTISPPNLPSLHLTLCWAFLFVVKMMISRSPAPMGWKRHGIPCLHPSQAPTHSYAHIHTE